ncbi:hypothetical protein BABINDRAFT_162306 [Babjeviella inositovora NRRL Y-12698]|uniref:Protein kinase domain-containing protein n=1 Tax=Babjeviella inositovora NRRL Y-12698 TaxID=984486 RepID=A0A1E3QQC0_9ASCO|nr:uncharacterized protein BABINDRAFT_162306 [Babjeviella inositovora NRRL Y-12698]ODQ79272.1 hypothetical protein BABINDRAFT_162306 [Babjeviella inositovora NRRL Y-12698]
MLSLNLDRYKTFLEKAKARAKIRITPDKSSKSISPDSSLANLSHSGKKLLTLGKKLRTLGTGIGGVVDLYQQGSQLYVIKTFHTKEKLESREDYKMRVLNEYHVLAKLPPHPHVIGAIKYTESSALSRDYRVRVWFEYSRFPMTLAFKNGLHPAEIACYWKQMVSAVAFLHSHNVCHRDLKLDNMMVSETGIVQLIDFGAAADLGPEVRPAVGIVGTGQYMAPEMFGNISYQGMPVDVWLLAVLYVYLSQRQFPWKWAKHEDETFLWFEMAQLDGNVAAWGAIWLDQYPTGMQKLLQKMFTLNLSARITSLDVCGDPGFVVLDLCDGEHRCSIDHRVTLRTIE